MWCSISMLWCKLCSGKTLVACFAEERGCNGRRANKQEAGKAAEEEREEEAEEGEHREWAALHDKGRGRGERLIVGGRRGGPSASHIGLIRCADLVCPTSSVYAI